jgi:hypothetical protein
VATLEVDSTPTGALLIVDGFRFRFSQHTVTQIHSIVSPLRAVIGSRFLTSDDPPSPLIADLTVETTSDRRAEIWYSDWIAEDYLDLVLGSMDWLAEQTGVESVEREDHCILEVSGCVDPNLFDQLRSWWKVRVAGFDQTHDWPVSAS